MNLTISGMFLSSIFTSYISTAHPRSLGVCMLAVLKFSFIVPGTIFGRLITFAIIRLISQMGRAMRWHVASPPASIQTPASAWHLLSAEGPKSPPRAGCIGIWQGALKLKQRQIQGKLDCKQIFFSSSLASQSNFDLTKDFAQKKMWRTAAKFSV